MYAGARILPHKRIVYVQYPLYRMLSVTCYSMCDNIRGIFYVRGTCVMFALCARYFSGIFVRYIYHVGYFCAIITTFVTFL